MDQDSLLPLELPAVARKKVSLAFDDGRLSSNGGVLLLREVERGLRLAGRLAACMTDRRDPARVDHTVVEMLKLRMFAIAAGYEDADDCDSLRDDPIFKMAVGRAPETGDALCSQPTMSRLENTPSRTEIARMMAAMVFEREGIKVVVDQASLELVAGSEIDYVEDLIGSSFAVRNPNATSSCGCGVSFSI